MVMDPVTALQLAQWRRATAALYARVREQADPVAAHALWRAGRDGLMSSHPQSPLPEGDPLRVTGVPYWPYDLGLRFVVPVEPAAEPRRLEIDTGADGVTRLEQVGWVTIPGPVGLRLALWWLDEYGGGLFCRSGTRQPAAPATVAAATCSTRRKAPISDPTAGTSSSTSIHVPPIVPVQPALGVPAGACREHHRRGSQRGGTGSPERSTGRLSGMTPPPAKYRVIVRACWRSGRLAAPSGSRPRGRRACGLAGDLQRPVVQPLFDRHQRNDAAATAGQIRDLGQADLLVIERDRAAARGDRGVELVGLLPVRADLYAGRQGP